MLQALLLVKLDRPGTKWDSKDKEYFVVRCCVALHGQPTALFAVLQFSPDLALGRLVRIHVACTYLSPQTSRRVIILKALKINFKMTKSIFPGLSVTGRL